MVIIMFFFDMIPSGQRANITNWKDPPFSMGKSNINHHFQ